jgi:nucleoside-diphosphate-sugar epimerase
MPLDDRALQSPTMTSSPSGGGTVLLTGLRHPLGRPAMVALEAAGQSVRPTDEDLTNPEAVAHLVEGVTAVVHLEPLALAESLQPDGELLDQAARGTHVLMKAAAEGSVQGVVQGSSLSIMDAYGQDLEVTEAWRPRPLPDPVQLAPYLAELAAREFTRDVALARWLRITCLRFAPLTGEEPLNSEDAAGAIVSALARVTGTESESRGHRWSVLHIAPATPSARYSSHAAARAIGYGITQEAAR